MARRRLLTILATSALLTAAFSGPAAALEIVEATQESVVEVTEETVTATEDVLDTVDAEPVAEPVAEVTDAVEEPLADTVDAIEETIAPEPTPSQQSQPPSPSRSEQPAARTTTDTAGYDSLVAAGDVGAAPSLASLTGTGGSAPAPQSSFDLPLAAPASAAAAPAAPTTDVEAPQVAPAPAEVVGTSAPSVLAQPASSSVPDEGAPVMALVALASVVAAGFGTVRGARVSETN